ncbi:MAG: chemotaxis protein, partial [Candidatus Omnitrophica bacterium]|nr:chemotaxis protein [Candidatus Omnitrophota bacterium]
MATKFGTAILKGEESFKVGQEVARKAVEKAGIKQVDLAIVFCSSKYNYQEVVKGVREVTAGAPLIGCSSAGEFNEERVDKESVVCAVINSNTHKFFTALSEGIKEDEIKALQEASKNIPSPIADYPYLSAILLIDGLAGKGEESVLAGLNALGPNVKFSGGAAGDDLKFKETYVFADDKVAANAVSLALVASRIPVAIGVKHGHSPISPPLTITKAEGNIVYEVNHRPAFEVWKEYARENALGIGIDVDKMSEVEAIQTFFTRYEGGL